MTNVIDRNKEPVLAVYPGSFDPITVGHMDIIYRAADLFDELIVCIMVNHKKHCLFSEAERLEQVKMLFKDTANIRVDSYHGLAMAYAKEKKAKVLVRGLRSPEDFSYEYNMTFFNHRISPEVETVFLGASMDYVNISSSAVRELLAFGGNISGLVPKEIEKAIIERGGKYE